MVRIGVVGDFQPTNETHLATTAAFVHAGDAAGLTVEVSWIPTPDIALDPETTLRGLGGCSSPPAAPTRAWMVPWRPSASPVPEVSPSSAPAEGSNT